MSTLANKARLVLALRRHGITETRVLAAMERVPRGWPIIWVSAWSSAVLAKVKLVGWQVWRSLSRVRAGTAVDNTVVLLAADFVFGIQVSTELVHVKKWVNYSRKQGELSMNRCYQQGNR